MKCLPHRGDYLSSDFPATMQKPGVKAYVCDPRTVKVYMCDSNTVQAYMCDPSTGKKETGGCLELTPQPA